MSPLRRLVATLLALLVVLGALASAPVAVAAPGQAGSSVDTRLSQAQCALTGRVWVGSAHGCARRRCVAGAHLVKTGFDAELCGRSGREGREYAQPIAASRCRALGRVWIGEINSCASNPDRSRSVVAHAPQCASRVATYVDHRETEGWYDECLSPAKARAYTRIADRTHSSLNAVAQDRGRANCSYRGGWVMTAGLCTKRSGPPPADQLGGFDMVGDSVSWRAENELAALRPDWNLDLRPGRRLDELPGRLDHFRADHGDPTALVVELGTNRRRGFSEADFQAVMATVPASTPVMFLLPYRERQPGNAGPVHATKKYQAWMRDLAAVRPSTCLVDWPSYAAAHLDHLVDGEHPATDSETWYARFVIRSWKGCAASFA